MAILIFKLANVPDDEADDVRQLLHDNEIHFYETNAGLWKVGLDAIWLPDDSQQAQAKALLSEYQRTRAATQQQAYAELEARGEAPTLVQKIAANPLRFVAQLLAIIFVLSLSTIPFWFAFE